MEIVPLHLTNLDLVKEASGSSIIVQQRLSVVTNSDCQRFEGGEKNYIPMLRENRFGGF